MSQDLYIAVFYMIFAFSIHSLILHVCLFVLPKNVFFYFAKKGKNGGLFNLINGLLINFCGDQLNSLIIIIDLQLVFFTYFLFCVFVINLCF